MCIVPHSITLFKFNIAGKSPYSPKRKRTFQLLCTCQNDEHKKQQNLHDPDNSDRMS